jgi:hypothetical protein
LPQPLLSEARRLAGSAGETDIRVRRPMEMARYRRTEP